MSASVSTGVRRRTDEDGVVRVGAGADVLSDGPHEGVGVGVVSLAAGACDCASDVNAWPSSSGRILPRLDARRRMPVAARADSENRGGVLSCNTSRRVVGLASQTEDEDPSAALGHSEVTSVEHPERQDRKSVV